MSSQGHSNVKLQLAATFCISNLIWNEEDSEADAMTGCYMLGGTAWVLSRKGLVVFVDVVVKIVDQVNTNLNRSADEARSVTYTNVLRSISSLVFICDSTQHSTSSVVMYCSMLYCWTCSLSLAPTSSPLTFLRRCLSSQAARSVRTS